MRKTRKVLFVVMLSIIMIMSQATGIVAFAESSNESSPPQQTETIVETQQTESSQELQQEETAVEVQQEQNESDLEETVVSDEKTNNTEAMTSSSDDASMEESAGEKKQANLPTVNDESTEEENNTGEETITEASENQTMPTEESAGEDDIITTLKAPAESHSITVVAPTSGWWVSVRYVSGGQIKTVSGEESTATVENVDAGSSMKIHVGHYYVMGSQTLGIDITSTSSSVQKNSITQADDGSYTVNIAVDESFHEDTTLTIVPEGDVHTLTFDSNGVTASQMPGTISVDAGKPVVMPTKTPESEGYNFRVWNTRPDGSGEDVYAGSTFILSEDMTLYAQWTDNRGEYSVTVELGDGTDQITGIRLRTRRDYTDLQDTGVVAGQSATVSGVKPGDIITVSFRHANNIILMPGSIDAHGANWVDTANSNYITNPGGTWDSIEFDTYYTGTKKINSDTTITFANFSEQNKIHTGEHEGHKGGVAYDISYQGNAASNISSAPAGATVTLRRYPTDWNAYFDKSSEYWKYYIDSYTLSYGDVTQTYAGDSSFVMPQSDITVTPHMKEVTYIDIIEIGDVFEDILAMDAVPPFTGAVHSDIYALDYEEWNRYFDGTWCSSSSSEESTLKSTEAGDELHYGADIYFLKPGYQFADKVTVRAGSHEKTFNNVEGYTLNQGKYNEYFFYDIFSTTVKSSEEPMDAVYYDANGGEGAPGPDERVGDNEMHVSYATPARASKSQEITISFDANGGNSAPDQQKAKRTTTYTFTGWNTKADGTGTSYSAGDPIDPSGKVTLYAQYNTEVKTDSIKLEAASADENLTFIGWNSKPDGSGKNYESGKQYTFDEDITLFAQWKNESVTPPATKKYTVTFDTNGHGSAPSPQIVESGKKSVKPAEPSESGWTFGGWYKEAKCKNAFDFETPITENITLFAKWTKDEGGNTPTPKNYSVTFQTNGGSPVATQTVEEGKMASKPANPTKEGFIFDGWFRDGTFSEAFNFSIPITANTTVYAKWLEKGSEPIPVTKYTITYKLNGGTLNGKTGDIAIQVVEGTTITLPMPTRRGYTFDYWEGSRYEAGTSYKVTGDHTFTAQWKVNSATTNLNTNVKGTSPQTGDNSHMEVWIALMVLSLVSIGGIAIYDRRKKLKDKSKG